MTTFALFPTNSNITRKMDSDRDIAAELQTPLREGFCLFLIKLNQSKLNSQSK